MWKEMARSPFLMIGLSNEGRHSEPMTAQLDPDARSEFWFFAERDNRIAKGGEAMAQFVAKDHGLFACIRGTIAEETRPDIFDKYWSDEIALWFEGGRDNPNLIMLRFGLERAEIWQADHPTTGKFKCMTEDLQHDPQTPAHTEVSL